MKQCKETVFETKKEDTDYYAGTCVAKCVECGHKIKIAFPLIEEMYRQFKKHEKEIH